MTPPVAPASGRRDVFRRSVRIVAAFWLSRDWKIAWLGLFALLGFTLSNVSLALWFNRWERDFFDSLSEIRPDTFAHLVMIFGLIIGLQLTVTALGDFAQAGLGLRWRGFLTQNFLARYMALNRFYDIERRKVVDNPDQRIAQDMALLSAAGVGGQAGGGQGLHTIVVAIVGSLVSAIGFGAVLYGSSRPIAIPGTGIAIPGDLILYALLYVGVSAFVVSRFGRPVIRRNIALQHAEADFRSGLVHVRRNSAQISFARAQPTESRTASAAFGGVFRKFVRFSVADVILTGVIFAYQALGSMAPLFIIVPRYFAGEISFGEAMATQGAFEVFTGAISYFIMAYSIIAAQLATLARIRGLDEALDGNVDEAIGLTRHDDTTGAIVDARGLSIDRPDGRSLLRIPEWTVRPGERWIIRGSTGTGKSTLLRVLAGLWPDGSGTVAVAMPEKVLFVPQRLYLPEGTLKAAICFPHESDRFDDATIEGAMHRLGLSEHVARLHEARAWQDELSPGEQQRVALVRILAQPARAIFLDEATSALDPENTRLFMETLLTVRSDATIVSVVHQPGLERFYTHTLTISDGIAVPSEIERETGNTP